MSAAFFSAVFSKQVGRICGTLLTNLAAWLGGTWFDVVGGIFKKIVNALPFVYAVETKRAVLAGNTAGIFLHLWWVLGYVAAAVFPDLRQMRSR